MPLLKQHFDIPKGVSLQKITLQLQAALSLSEVNTQTLKRIFYDSFDWRLFNQGEQLEAQIHGKQRDYQLKSTKSAACTLNLRISNEPRFIWDFPDSNLKNRLKPTIEMRALMPVVSIQSKFNWLLVRNKDEKIVVRIRVENNKLLNSANSHSTNLCNRVTIIPVKGYQKPFEKTLHTIQQNVQLATTNGDDLYKLALLAAEKQPGHYSSKLNIQLDPMMRADAATKKILLHLLDTMLINEQGTKDDIDSEFLHDFRVAVRRTRSALSQIKSVIPQSTVDRFKREFAWLGAITTPTRDLDVYLLKFDEYRNNVPVDMQNALDPLHNFLQHQQSAEQQKLKKALGSARYKKIIQSWRKYLETPVPSQSLLRNATRPVAEIANERIWRMYKRVLKEGNAINADSPADDLHELRKTCKKLRYLMEFFHTIYPAGKIATLIKALKQLQNNLGDYQDLHVQVESLKSFSEQMMKQDNPPPETLLAMGTLIEGLDKRQYKVREEFKARFKQFTLAKYKQLFHALFLTPISVKGQSNPETTH